MSFQEIEQTAKLKNQNLYFSFPQALKSITDNSSTKQAQLNSILEEKTQEIIDLQVQMKLQNKSISPISGSSPENSSKNEMMNESESNSDWILLDNEKKRQASGQSNKSKSSGTGNLTSNSSENLNENLNLNNTASLMNDALEEGEMVDGEDSGSSGSGSSSSQSLSESDESGTSEITSSIDEIGTSV